MNIDLDIIDLFPSRCCGVEVRDGRCTACDKMAGMPENVRSREEEMRYQLMWRNAFRVWDKAVDELLARKGKLAPTPK